MEVTMLKVEEDEDNEDDEEDGEGCVRRADRSTDSTSQHVNSEDDTFEGGSVLSQFRRTPL